MDKETRERIDELEGAMIKLVARSNVLQRMVEQLIWTTASETTDFVGALRLLETNVSNNLAATPFGPDDTVSLQMRQHANEVLTSIIESMINAAAKKQM